MTKENVTSYCVHCPRCGIYYIPEIGKLCRCEYGEEPVVKDWEDQRGKDVRQGD